MVLALPENAAIFINTSLNSSDQNHRHTKKKQRQQNTKASEVITTFVSSAESVLCMREEGEGYLNGRECHPLFWPGDS